MMCATISNKWTSIIIKPKLPWKIILWNKQSVSYLRGPITYNKREELIYTLSQGNVNKSPSNVFSTEIFFLKKIHYWYLLVETIKPWWERGHYCKNYRYICITVCIRNAANLTQVPVLTKGSK
jgi:hypothetical protein